jgi:hypothetical protein
MIDTGAAINLIKRKHVHPDLTLDTHDINLLTGITTEKIQTLGSIGISIYGYPVTLHVVPDHFSISQEGILGAEFLEHTQQIEFNDKT